MGLRPAQGDENGFCPATALYGSAALPFVIPSGAKRSGGICSSADLYWKCFSTEWSWACGPPKEMKNAFYPATVLYGSAAPPLSSRAQPRDLQFRGPFLEMFFDGAYPDFLLLYRRQGRVCGFPQRKPHEACGTH
jgi:hypothetical protein